MAKLSKNHISFLLNNTLNRFVAFMNRSIALRNKHPDHFTTKTVDQISGSFAPDFTSFTIQATTVVSTFTRPYEPDCKQDAIERTVELFKSYNWKKALPEVLASAYTLDIASIPTAQAVAVDEDKINDRITVTHSIVFKTTSYNKVEQVINAYHAADVNNPAYFHSIQITGVRPETLSVNYGLTIVANSKFPRCLISEGHQVNSNTPLMSMIFNHRYMDFSAFNNVHQSGVLHTPSWNKEELKLNFNIHTIIEAELEANGRTKFISVNIIKPVIEADNRFFWQNIDMIGLLSERTTQAEIKKFLKAQSVKGTKINWVKTHGLKINNVALSNNAKYKTMTFIGSLMGRNLIIEIGKRGAVKITDLFGLDLALSDINKAERITAIITRNLGDLFANDRGFASSVFYSIMPPTDVKQTTILFS